MILVAKVTMLVGGLPPLQNHENTMRQYIGLTTYNQVTILIMDSNYHSQDFTKECVTEKYFLCISEPKHMLEELKRTISMRRFFRAPKTYA